MLVTDRAFPSSLMKILANDRKEAILAQRQILQLSVIVDTKSLHIKGALLGAHGFVVLVDKPICLIHVQPDVHLMDTLSVIVVSNTSNHIVRYYTCGQRTLSSDQFLYQTCPCRHNMTWAIRS